MSQALAGKVGRNYGRQKSVAGRGKGYGYQSLGVDLVEMSAIREFRNRAGDPGRTSSAIEPFQSLEAFNGTNGNFVEAGPIVDSAGSVMALPR
jgi:hypothetical protein